MSQRPPTQARPTQPPRRARRNGIPFGSPAPSAGRLNGFRRFDGNLGAMLSRPSPTAFLPPDEPGRESMMRSGTASCFRGPGRPGRLVPAAEGPRKHGALSAPFGGDPASPRPFLLAPSCLPASLGVRPTDPCRAPCRPYGLATRAGAPRCGRGRRRRRTAWPGFLLGRDLVPRPLVRPVHLVFRPFARRRLRSSVARPPQHAASPSVTARRPASGRNGSESRRQASVVRRAGRFRGLSQGEASGALGAGRDGGGIGGSFSGKTVATVPAGG